MNHDKSTLKWEQMLEHLMRTMGPVAGKKRWRSLWRDAGEAIIREYEDEQRLRESLRLLDAAR